uniref:WW domain-containing protein n=1 Tax=Lotharella globosa TaxID=91324 RepID=A0A7S3ZAP2_9EUKA|mmetsp:Transcript_15634/g.31704  ORF Transcript_15634/g.31704 Transcript_15634/m.31704 type:complete len:291 (-) Transcript_15634:188-1060(-)
MATSLKVAVGWLTVLLASTHLGAHPARITSAYTRSQHRNPSSFLRPHLRRSFKVKDSHANRPTKEPLTIKRRKLLAGLSALPLLSTLPSMAIEVAKKLPDGWQAVRDPSSGEVYYWEVKTGVTQWDYPEKTNEREGYEYYRTAFGSVVEVPNQGIVWAKLLFTTLGILGLNIGLEYQEKFFPSLKEARENLEFYEEAAKKYGIGEDEPLEEAGFRAMEMMRKDRIAAVAGAASDLLEEVQGKVEDAKDAVNEAVEKADAAIAEEKAGQDAAEAKVETSKAADAGKESAKK